MEGKYTVRCIEGHRISVSCIVYKIFAVKTIVKCEVPQGTVKEAIYVCEFSVWNSRKQPPRHRCTAQRLQPYTVSGVRPDEFLCP